MEGTRLPSNSAVRLGNTLRVLKTLEQLRPIPRTDLAEVTGMSATSITRIINQLQALGLVEESTTSSSTGRGRRAIDLDIRPDGLYTAGFHPEGRMLHACLINFAGKVITESVYPIPEESSGAALFTGCINAFLDKLSDEKPAARPYIRAVGISIPGCVDAEHGSVVRSQYLEWSGVPLAEEVSRGIGLPVYIENDVRACLSWERRSPARAGQNALAYLYAGSSGIGFANTDGGSIIRGFENAAGEIQDMPLMYSGILSDTMLPERLIGKSRAWCPEVNSLDDIACAAKLGAAWARLIINEFRNSLKNLLTIIRCFLNPCCVIVGGDAITSFRDSLCDIITGDVVQGEDYEQACASGAAVIAMNSAVSSLIEKQDN